MVQVVQAGGVEKRCEGGCGSEGVCGRRRRGEEEGRRDREAEGERFKGA